MNASTSRRPAGIAAIALLAMLALPAQAQWRVGVGVVREVGVGIAKPGIAAEARALRETTLPPVHLETGVSSLAKLADEIEGVAPSSAFLGTHVPPTAASALVLAPTFAVASLLIDSASASRGQYEVLHVTRLADPVGDSLYRVESLGSPPKFIDSVQGLVAEANRIGAPTRSKAVYLFVDGPNPVKDRYALELSLRNIDSDVQIPLIVAGESLSTTSAFSTRDLVRPLGGPAQLGRVGVAARDDGGIHTQYVDLTSARGTVQMSILARSRALLDRFFRHLRNLFANDPDVASLSVLAVVQKAREAVGRDLNMTPAQVDAELAVNIRNSQLAGLPGTSADDRLVALAC